MAIMLFFMRIQDLLLRRENWAWGKVVLCFDGDAGLGRTTLMTLFLEEARCYGYCISYRSLLYCFSVDARFSVSFTFIELK
jgi:hypothetical protein